MFHQILLVKASHRVSPDLAGGIDPTFDWSCCKILEPCSSGPQPPIWPVPGHAHRLPFPDGSSQAGPRGLINAILALFPHHVSLKSLLRVTLENPKRMGRDGHESCWTEAREVRAGGMAF